MEPSMGRSNNFMCLPHPEKLRKFNITLNDIINAINANNQNTGGNIGARWLWFLRCAVWVLSERQRDIENIVIRSDGGVPLFIRDVSTIEIAPPSPSVCWVIM